MLSSPLTNSNDVQLISTIPTSQLISDWQQAFQIDIKAELLGCEEVRLYRCNQTNLLFFKPSSVEGSSALYEQLQKFDWYYMPRKWEHQAAIDDLKNSQKVVEIGCGKGAFVQRLCDEIGLDAQGIELNSSSVKFAQSKNIRVFSKDIHNLALEASNKFDAVCAFQVLEHVSQPKEFLNSLVKLVKPGGNLIISVPNSESFIKLCKNDLLNQPPHHLTQWSKDCFRHLTSIFPIEITHFKTEPLAEYHVEWYSSIQIERLPRIRLIRSIFHRVAGHLINPILKKYPMVRKHIIGHTLYVCFKKIE